DDNQVDRRPDRAWIGKLVNGRGNLSSCADALDPNRIDQNFDSAGAPPQDVENVADGSTARGRDNADTFRKFRQQFFPCRIEQSLRFQFSFERFEFRLQQTEPARLNDFDTELVLTTCLEDADVSVNLHLRAIRERLSKRERRVPKNHARDLGA